jgi:hypothetical protein
MSIIDGECNRMLEHSNIIRIERLEERMNHAMAYQYLQSPQAVLLRINSIKKQM